MILCFIMSSEATVMGFERSFWSFSRQSSVGWPEQENLGSADRGPAAIGTIGSPVDGKVSLYKTIQPAE